MLGLDSHLCVARTTVQIKPFQGAWVWRGRFQAPLRRLLRQGFSGPGHRDTRPLRDTNESYERGL